MKKSGFTLAEILISLIIIGIIASLTIPSLIQNTHKKEEQVKVKKAVSMINQALALEYALNGDIWSNKGKDEISSYLNYEYPKNIANRLQANFPLGTNTSFVTPEGFWFLWYDAYDYDDDGDMDVYVAFSVDGKNPEENWDSSYSVECHMDKHICVPYEYTSVFMNAKNPSKVKYLEGKWVEE